MGLNRYYYLTLSKGKVFETTILAPNEEDAHEKYMQWLDENLDCMFERFEPSRTELLIQEGKQTRLF